MPTQRPATIRQRTRLHEEAVEILEARYAEPIELETVAKSVACSPRQLQRAFSEIGRTTFRSHLTRIRMDRAARLLAGGDLPVREVARSVGYRQPAQFAKAFRRRHNLAPAAYRAAWRRRLAAANAGHAGRSGLNGDAPANGRPGPTGQATTNGQSSPNGRRGPAEPARPPLPGRGQIDTRSPAANGVQPLPA